MARTKRPPAKVDRGDAAVKIPAASDQPSTLSDNRGRALLYLILLLAACLCLYRLLFHAAFIATCAHLCAQER